MSGSIRLKFAAIRLVEALDQAEHDMVRVAIERDLDIQERLAADKVAGKIRALREKAKRMITAGEA